MADKEATLYVVDVGWTMGQKRHGRSVTDLEWSMQYVWSKITATVATGRKTACLGVLSFRSDETNNELSEDDGYGNISVLKPLGQALMPDLRELREKIKPSETNSGDAISAIIVALMMMEKFTKKLKYIRKIVLVTDGLGDMDNDNIDDIAEKAKGDGVELIILGTDFDDPDWGVKEEDKDNKKRSNEAHFKALADKSDGVFGSMHQAVEQSAVPTVKHVRPINSYRGVLTLGNPEEYETAMSIDVERFPRTKIARAPGASSYVLKHEQADTGESSATIGRDVDKDGDTSMNGQNKDEMTAVLQHRAYYVADEKVEGGKREVSRDDLAKGYEYGRTAVHISEAEENVTKFEAHQGLEIVGFVPAENYPHYMNLSQSNVIVAQRTNNKAIMALSSFIHTLYELDNYAIARLVTKDGRAPVLIALAPSIESGFECLIDIELPFAEDVRGYKFPPLDRIPMVSGKILTEHRNLPNADLKKAMNELVDAMDISEYGHTDEGEKTEFMPMEDTFSPILHRINQAISFRAVHPDEPVPPPADILTKFMHPPKGLVERNQPTIDRLKSAADVKMVPPKSLSRGFERRANRAAEQPRSGLDVEALLKNRSQQNRGRISPDNAVAEFKQQMQNPESVAVMQDSIKQMGDIATQLIRESLGDTKYARAVETISVLREECVDYEEAKTFNDFAQRLKSQLLKGELGGDRREMWWLLRSSRLGLIEARNVTGGASEDEARLYFSRDQVK